MYKIKNILFFILFLTVNIRLFKLFFHRLYIPVFVQFEWLKKYNIHTIIDIGAYHGNVTHALHYLFPKASVYVFEPDEKNCRIIANKIRSKKLIINKTALSDRNRLSDFFEYSNRSLSSLLPINEKKKSYIISELIQIMRVPTTTLDQYFKDKKLTPHIFLKIDTQGTEGQILKGGKKFLKNVSIIHIEASFEELYKSQPLFHEIYRYLIDLGFTYIGENRESHFYPNFSPTNQINVVFINSRLLDIIY